MRSFRIRSNSINAFRLESKASPSRTAPWETAKASSANRLVGKEGENCPFPLLPTLAGLAVTLRNIQRGKLFIKVDDGHRTHGNLETMTHQKTILAQVFHFPYVADQVLGTACRT